MTIKAMMAKPIGISTGICFAGTSLMIGMMTSAFILWAFSCLGSGACDLVSGMI